MHVRTYSSYVDFIRSPCTGLHRLLFAQAIVISLRLVLDIVLVMPKPLSLERFMRIVFPHGYRTPYRISSGRSPSDDHSSDSEDTLVHKQRWKLLARWVYQRWRLFTLRTLRKRWCKTLLERKLLPKPLRHGTIADAVAQFI